METTRPAGGVATDPEGTSPSEARSRSREPAWRSLLRRGRRALRRGDENTLGEVIYALGALGTPEATAAAAELNASSRSAADPAPSGAAAPTSETSPPPS